MIALSAENGTLLKLFPEASQEVCIGFHRVLGFVSERAAQERSRARRKRGLHVSRERKADWLFRLRFNSSREPIALENCEIRKLASGGWTLSSPIGTFSLELAGDTRALPLKTSSAQNDKSDRSLIGITAAIAIAVTAVLAFYPAEKPSVAPEEIQPLSVKIVPEQEQKMVRIAEPGILAPSENAPVTPAQQMKRAVAQDLGFLGLLGKKNLKKALGGVPTTIREASPGAGAGGKAGSGGELLVGLGQGVKRASVGNTGVKGLGGIGTKGAGGGAGGYGNTLIGSGEGRALSAVPLGQDVVLEGGLSKAVIQATIAKYLSQVRACYERGLMENPGLTGQVTMGFEVGGTGRVNFARVAKSSLGDAGVEKCISTRMLGWIFPKPVGGVAVRVSYPFLLRPIGS